jgi:hypothetical protein
LHSESGFEGTDACVESGVVCATAEVETVEILEKVEFLLLMLDGGGVWVEVWERFFAGDDVSALMASG